VGDHVWVDLGVKKIAGDGIYVVRMQDGSLFRRVQQLPTGELRVSTDDPAYAPQILKGKAVTSMRVIGKAIARTHRTAL
jgi:phage repressor protein C with HTH and peptisase S24 domain